MNGLLFKTRKRSGRIVGIRRGSIRVSRALALAISIGAVAGTGVARVPGQLDCPVAQTQAGGGVLRETPKQIRAVGDRLGLGSKNEIAGAARMVKDRHPSASASAVTNFLITAYCPKINERAGLSEAAKRQTMRSFAMHVQQVARSAGSTSR